MSHEFRLNDYLARIGFRGTIEPNLLTLSAMQAAHVDANGLQGDPPRAARGRQLASRSW